MFFFSFCHQYPELLVASYNNNEEAPHEPDGVALVWNMKYKKATPEYVFHCQVLSSSTSPSAYWWFLPWQACNNAGQPLFAYLLSSLAHTPFTPPAFIHIVWVHCAGIHLHHIYSQTHVHEAPEKTCGAGVK